MSHKFTGKTYFHNADNTYLDSYLVITDKKIKFNIQDNYDEDIVFTGKGDGFKLVSGLDVDKRLDISNKEYELLRYWGKYAEWSERDNKHEKLDIQTWDRKEIFISCTKIVKYGYGRPKSLRLSTISTVIVLDEKSQKLFSEFLDDIITNYK